MLGRNTPQIATVLPHLVRILHWPSEASSDTLDKGSAADLAGRMARLQVRKTASQLPATPLDTRARFASYYLLHTLLGSKDRSSFSRLLGDIVDFSPNSTLSRLSCNHPQIQFVLRVFQLDISGNYAGISKILREPRKYDKFAWILLRTSVVGHREYAWEVTKASYLATSDKKWLARSLLLEDQDETALGVFLEGRGWKDQIEADGAILLKRAAKPAG